MDSDRKLGGLTGKLGKGTFDAITADSKDQSKQNSAALTIVLALIGILIVVGTEPLKVLLRRNIGKYALGIGSIIVAGLVYILIGYFLVDTAKDIFEKQILSAGAAFYYTLGVGTLICGVKEYFNSSADFYRGDSVFFGFLLDKGFKKEFIWTVVEPVVCLAAGLLLFLLHPLIGLPLVVTSISFLFNEWYNVSRRPAIQRDTVAHMHVSADNRQRATNLSDDVFHVN